MKNLSQFFSLSPDALLHVLRRLDARSAHLWGPDLLRSTLSREAPIADLPIHLYVCITDHFEPRWRKPSLEEERRRVELWRERYPALADRHRDSLGRAHVRTLFFPVEEYRREHLDHLGVLREKNLVDVEVHLHHENDTAENLRETLVSFAELLHREHGMLRRDPQTQRLTWAFIHGNWALDNSHPDKIYCGVDNEISTLIEAGCYCDMTLPCVPSPAQARKVNKIYYAMGTPGRARGHDHGRDVYVGSARRDHELMLIPGPLGLHWRSRSRGVLPRVEAAMLEPENPIPHTLRIESWVRNAPAIRGAPNHRFIKLHAHGCNGTAPEWFLSPDGPFDRMLTTLESLYRDNNQYVLHYVTARELYETVKSLEDGSLSNG